jgi:hypothetical protein
MALPELLSPAVTIVGALLLGLLGAMALAGKQVRPQPVPVRRDSSRRRR